MPIALYLDLIWRKRRMMEVYLNIAEWGEGIFGAEAAARHHFGKSARRPDPQRGGASRRGAAEPADARRRAADGPSPPLAGRVLARSEGGAANACLRSAR